MKKVQPWQGFSNRSEDMPRKKQDAVELTEADLSQVSGGYPNVKRIVAQTVIGE